MSSEQNKQNPDQEKLETGAPAQNQDPWDNAEGLLRTKIDSAEVVSFIENMVQAMGSAAAEQYGGQLPQNQIRRPQQEQSRKYQSKTVAAIMQKLERVEKYPDLAKQTVSDPIIVEWLGRAGCKQKDYYEELEVAQELTSFFGGHRHFDLAVQAASKAISMTLLHRRDDEETLAELNWVLAELHAASNNMPVALDYMRKCLAIFEPGAGPGHPTYSELLSQLEETRQKSCLVATV